MKDELVIGGWVASLVLGAVPGIWLTLDGMIAGSLVLAVVFLVAIVTGNRVDISPFRSWLIGAILLFLVSAWCSFWIFGRAAAA